ncbi:MAG: FixH family protein [Gemmatimonadota bacterium]|nr:FixH family protein [Gemmatimonadota bacterium]
MSGSGRLWPWALGGVLGLTVIGNLWVMRLASADPSFSIEPDYYRKAVDWDSTMAQQARSAALGWRLTVRSMHPTADGRAVLAVQLVDPAGAPLSDATVTVAATHNARADRVATATLTPAGAGVYTGLIAGSRPGIWELRFLATRGNDRFAARLRHDTERDAPLP